jgi:ComF family protein
MLKSILARVRTETLDALYPIYCLGCGEPGDAICRECRATLPRLAHPYCAVCAQPRVRGTCEWCRHHVPAVDGIIAPYLYVSASPIHSAITRLKFAGWRALAPELGGLLAAFLDPRSLSVDLVVPVPGHPRRLRSRGFNQAALIADELVKRAGLPIADNLLVRTKNAPSQLSMGSHEARWLNVERNFSCGETVEGLRILVVDDLVTTGATMSACASALKEAGASKVVGIAVARAP